jgi:hypothetical protein
MVLPKTGFFYPVTKIHNQYVRGMAMQRDEVHPVDDYLGAIERMPLAGLDVRRGDGFRLQIERSGRILLEIHGRCV